LRETIMVKFIKWVFVVLSIMIIWLALNIVATKQAWFKAAIAPPKDSASFMAESVKSIKEKAKGNGIFLLINNGEVFDEYSYSQGNTVTNNTVFGVASLGKWVAAIGVMTLVEQGKLDLDIPVSHYLTRWQLPNSQFNNDEVTVRRLLSHTAGITDGLGHNGFASKDEVQPLEQHLTYASDADEGVSGKVQVTMAPGSQFKYSGGSYNLLQLIIEEVSEMPFSSYMEVAVFKPLKMTNTGYDHEKSGINLAQYFNDKGDVRAYPFYTSLAATGLYTTASDLVKFMTLQLPTNVAVKTQHQLLSLETLKQMRTPHASTMGIDIWGLGVMLFADNNGDDFIIGHGGQSPSLNATIRLNPSNGDGIIMLTTGNRALAADTATQWTLWETGNPDMYMLKNMIPEMLKRVAIGCFVIVIIILILFVKKKSSKTKR
jgi:CubicO group peptidase (beta-lactamase class C family)